MSKNLGKDLRNAGSKPRDNRRKFDPSLKKAPKPEGVGYGRSIGLRHSVIKRWLHSKVGQNWDLAYSELCGKVDRLAVDYIKGFVRSDIIMGDPPTFANGAQLRGWWIHPDTKILQYTDFDYRNQFVKK